MEQAVRIITTRLWHRDWNLGLELNAAGGYKKVLCLNLIHRQWMVEFGKGDALDWEGFDKVWEIGK